MTSYAHRSKSVPVQRPQSSSGMMKSIADVDWQERYKVYNKNNIYIQPDHIVSILRKGGIRATQIQQLSVWQEAFTHISYTKNNPFKHYNYELEEKQMTKEELKTYIPIQDTSYERLEWLGDAILQMTSAIFLFERFDQQDEGFLTKNRSKLVRTDMLAQLAKHIGLPPYILMSHHVEQYCNGRSNDKVLEDAFEAFIGAMYLEFNYLGRKNALEICSTFIDSIYQTYVHLTDVIQSDDNYKEKLMVYCHKTQNGYNPLYQETSDSNPAITDPNAYIIGTRTFKVQVLDSNGKVVGFGKGKRKKDAEQEAAKDALSYYGLF
jgi:ribonuclease III